MYAEADRDNLGNTKNLEYGCWYAKHPQEAKKVYGSPQLQVLHCVADLMKDKKYKVRLRECALVCMPVPA